MSNIMLFGKTIQFDLNSDFNSAEHTTTTTTTTSSDHNLTSSSSSIVNLDHKISSPTTTIETETEESTEENSTAPNKTELLPPFEDKLQPTTSSPNSQTESTNIKERQNSTTTTSDGGGGGGSQSQPLKKPDQILPCPRCKSTNTKFCYFNNYNINQPRHFCRCCQRYWTAGGTMRNIPVGSGRRNNNKTSDDSSSFNHQNQQSLQVFVPPCPMDERMIYNNPTPNLQHNPQSASLPPPYPQCYYWGGGVWTVAPPYWVNPSNSDQYPSSSSATTGISFTDETPTVRKRKRNEKQETSHHKEKTTSSSNNNINVLIPKTLRMTDSNEAAKSSICATLGRITEENVKGDRIGSETARNKNSIRMVTGFRRTDEIDEEDALNGVVLQANPSALSMSIKFRETAQ